MYIGKIPTVGNFQICDAISVVDAQAAYTMQVSSVNVSPESANHMIVSLNGVIQKPTDAYTVSGSTITFASALETGDVIDFIQILGNVLDLGVPSDNTVTTAKLSDSSVSLAKLTATGTKNSTTFLRGDNTFNAPPAGGIENITTFRMTTNFTMSSSNNQITANWSQGGASLGTLISESSGTFSFPQTGLYIVAVNFALYRIQGDSNYVGLRIKSTTDNSSYSYVSSTYTHLSSETEQHSSIYNEFIFDVTNTTNDKIQIDYQAENASNIRLIGSSSADVSYIRFIRLGDT